MMLGWAWLATATVPDASALSALQQAKVKMDGLNELRRQADRAAYLAKNLAAIESKDASDALQLARKANDEARQAIPIARDCFPALQEALVRNRAAAQTVEYAVAYSLKAAKALATAPSTALSSVANASTAAFKRRTEAEQALANHQLELERRAGDCIKRIRSADQAVDRAYASVSAIQSQARSLGSNLKNLREAWEAATITKRAAVDAKWLLDDAQPLVLPQGENIRRLEETLPTLPARGASADANQLLTLVRGQWNVERIASRQGRLQDAAAYIDLMVLPGTCSVDVCSLFQSERRELEVLLNDTQLELGAARTQMADANTVFDRLLSPLEAALQASAKALEASQQAMTTLAEATDASNSAYAAAQALYRAADAAYAQAQREWRDAYRLAHGEAPPPYPQPKPEAKPEAKPPYRPDIRAHAYEFFNTLNKESSGFASYTYVLVRSASDLKNPAVQRRFDQLLATLQTVSPAASLSQEQKKNTNLFCIPLKSEGGSKPGSVTADYASDLAQQLKMRAQLGVLTRKEVSDRLTKSPGPFLVTLPGRIMDAATDGAPLLFADLSDAPADAIADLTQSYMGGLLEDFPTRQALWKPPVGQRVALQLIQLASEIGQIVTSVIPSAQARQR
jgi:hypothetical protein